MRSYIEVCVQLRKSKQAKDGLHQYRTICSQANVGSLEVVIRFFLTKADEDAAEAQEKADELQAMAQIDDLDADEVPAGSDLAASTASFISTVSSVGDGDVSVAAETAE